MCASFSFVFRVGYLICINFCSLSIYLHFIKLNSVTNIHALVTDVFLYFVCDIDACISANAMFNECIQYYEELCFSSFDFY